MVADCNNDHNVTKNLFEPRAHVIAVLFNFHLAGRVAWKTVFIAA
jgi:hypothetical protein